MKNVLAFFDKYNNLLAAALTAIVGSMWTAYAFAAMVFVPFFVPSTQTTIMFISSSFLQLILLPIIMVGQNLASKKSEKRAQQDHYMIKKEFSELREMHQEMRQLVLELTEKK